jgi:hypothetical protein
VSLPDTADRGFADAGLLGHRFAAPVSFADRLFLSGFADELGDSRPRVPLLSPRPCCVLLDSAEAVFSEARPPLSHRSAGDPESLCDIAIFKSVGCKQDHARSKHEAYSSARTANKLLQKLSLVRLQRDLSCTPHDLFLR